MRRIKLLVAVLGLSSVVNCIVLFLPDQREDDDSIVRRSAAGRFSRHTRNAAGDDCSSRLITRETVSTLTSPNYPDYYPRNANCQWVLTTLQPNQTISILIDKLALEKKKGCRPDYLQVFLGSNDSAPSLGPFCGHLQHRTLDTNVSTVLLVFRSNEVYEDRGFSIDYYIPTPNKGCPEFLTESVGTLTSPGFPNNYPDNADCSTLITAQPYHKIYLNFVFVDFEDGVNCIFDYVEVFDGSTTDSPLLGRICQQNNANHFQSSSNSLLVHFFSDRNNNGKGYKAKYFSQDTRSSPIGDCIWESGKKNGSISSPNYPYYYPSLANCSLWILAPLGSRILVTIDFMLLEKDASCSSDFLRISEGTPADSKILGKFCGRGSEPKTLKSSHHEVRVEFYSDSYTESSGFKLRYQFLEREEGKEEVAGAESDSGEMFSFTLKPADATLANGSSHMLHCATDHPNARIRWLKGDLFLARDNLMPGMRLLENNTLWIQQMRPHFAGEYTCIAVGEISAKAKIAFEGHKQKEADRPCKIELSKTPSDAEYDEGELAIMECRSDATGLSVSWEKDGKPIASQGHVTVLKNGYIFMREVRLKDTGLYTCVAKDALTGCKRKVSAKLKVNKKKKLEEICGISKFGQSAEEKSLGYIRGGHDAQKGAYPWQVMLWEPNCGSFCGASLLNERWIATAAHCVEKEAIPWYKIVIKLGKHTPFDKDVEEQDNNITHKSDVVVHPHWNNRTLDNDLALIRMRNRVSFTDYIRPVCLGDKNLSETLLSGDGDDTRIRMGTVIGWGDLTYKGKRLTTCKRDAPKYLQEIRLPIVDQQVCINSTRKLVTRNMFCAGYAQEVGDACEGDSGGPFLMEHGGRWYMVGIVSWGENCGLKNKYGFYTRVPNHLAWIHSIIQS